MNVEAKALNAANKASRTKIRTFRAYIKVMEQFFGDEDRPEVQKAHQEFREAEVVYLAAMKELSRVTQSNRKTTCREEP